MDLSTRKTSRKDRHRISESVRVVGDTRKNYQVNNSLQVYFSEHFLGLKMVSVIYLKVFQI